MSLYDLVPSVGGPRAGADGGTRSARRSKNSNGTRSTTLPAFARPMSHPLPQIRHPETLDAEVHLAPQLVRRLVVFHVAAMSMTECWRWFIEKNPGVTVDEANRKIIARLAMIETTRPLETIAADAAREQATLVRNWYHRTFAQTMP